MSDSILQEYVEPPVICSNYFVSTEHKTVQDDMLAGLKNRLIYTNGAKIPHDLFRHSLMFLQDYDQSGFLKGKIQVYRFDLDTLFPKLKNPMILLGADITDVSQTKQGIYFCVRAIASFRARDSAFYDGIDKKTLDLSSYVQEVVYVGKANNLNSRFAQHHKMSLFRRLNVEAVYFVEYNPNLYSESELLLIERKYIELLRPILNDRSLDFNCSKEEEDIKLKEAFNKGYAAATTKLMKYFDSEIQQSNLK